MTVKTVTTEQMRVNLRDILDDAVAGNETIIERYRKPTAVVVNYKQWQIMRRRWLDMQKQRLEEMKAGNYVTLEQAKEGLRQRGLID